jgi:DNA-binding transcriptional ArsR family regulator
MAKTRLNNPVADLVATQQETIEALLQRSGRDHVPIRRSFVQQRRRGGGASSLAAFVSSRRSTALDLYLLLHALASKTPYDVVLPAQVWARALGLLGRGAISAVSKNWSWLEEQKLVETEREGRLRRVVLLEESGTGGRYRHPARDKKRRGDYFKLPHGYWHARYMNRLNLPAKAVLLIALSLQMHESFVLPREQAAEWYGVSPDTIQRGVSELLHRGILRYRVEHLKAPLTARGFTIVRHYRLFDPFQSLDADEADWTTVPERWA